MAQIIRTVDMAARVLGGAFTVQALEVNIRSAPDGFGLVGTVGGHIHRVKMANPSTARTLRDQALRTAALWQAVLDDVEA